MSDPVDQVRAALAALCSRMSRTEIARYLRVSPVTLNAYSLARGTAGHRQIPKERLQRLLRLAARELQRASDEMMAEISGINADNPYRMAGPSVIHFSGGRTSAFMLHQILFAHGGKLPTDVVVVFANTGKEHPRTLDFVRGCASRWDVTIHWIEWDAGLGFREVDYATAARDGAPFQELIDRKKRLPNWKQRWCTADLKVRPVQLFMASRGFSVGTYTDVIGLRYDEGHRILKGLANAEKTSRRVLYPLARDRVVKADVEAFWRRQLFDLEIQPYEGNCDLCFLKGLQVKREIVRRNPAVAAWWAANETAEKGPGKRGWWSARHSVADIVASVSFGDEEPDTRDYDAECGLNCAMDVEEELAVELKARDQL